MPGSSRELSSSVNESSCGGMPGSSRELSSSVGYWTASSSLTSPRNSDIKLLLRRFTFSLSGALSASQAGCVYSAVYSVYINIQHQPSVILLQSGNSRRAVCAEQTLVECTDRLSSKWSKTTIV